MLKTTLTQYCLNNKKKCIFIVTFSVLFIWFLSCLPNALFNDPYSKTVNDYKGNLLSAKIASDGQWRFPENDSVNSKFAKCITSFEDQYFYSHPGINPASFWRALKQNIRAKKVVSGGSTITMQLVRLIRKNKKRTYSEKLIELIWALRLELTYSKDEILNLYCAHAPFGSNVVGIDAASWRYFGRSAQYLSWAECASLAVLPNAPSIIYPGKNEQKFKLKRNTLLLKLLNLKFINHETYLLSLQEPLPLKPFSLPSNTKHLLNRAISEHKNENEVNTTIQAETQARLKEILTKHAYQLQHN